MKILITGGTSLLGGALAHAFMARGETVTVLQRRPSGLNCRELLADIGDADAVRRAVVGAQSVLHVAAKVDVVGRWPEFERVNVLGTAGLLAAARRSGVSSFVQVSSPSVAHSGAALVGAGSTPADPDHARSNYSRSKALAENIALAADRPDFAVACIRPHLIWGPGDTQLVAPIVARARARRLPLIGSGAALVDTTYLDNAVDALMAAHDRCALVHGQSFVVSNGEPRPIAEILARMCTAAGVPGPRRRIPLIVAAAAGSIVETGWRALHQPGVPPMTRFVAEQMGTAHWFDQRRTRDALDWAPKISLDQGFELLARSFAR